MGLGFRVSGLGFGAFDMFRGPVEIAFWARRCSELLSSAGAQFGQFQACVCHPSTRALSEVHAS